jgi:hypothetical protein
MMAADPQKLPTREMIAATRAGKGGLDKAPGVPAMMKTVDSEQPLWAVVKVTEGYRQFPIASGFDHGSLVGRQVGPTFRLEMSAEGKDVKQLDISLHELQRYQKELMDWMRNVAPVMPPLQRVMRFLESIKPKVEGAKLTATATFEGPVTRLIVFMNFPYATAQPVEEGKPLPPPKKPEEAPLNPGFPRIR